MRRPPASATCSRSAAISWPLGRRTSPNPVTKRPDGNSCTRKTLQSARTAPITPQSLSTGSSSCRTPVSCLTARNRGICDPCKSLTSMWECWNRKAVLSFGAGPSQVRHSHRHVAQMAPSRGTHSPVDSDHWNFRARCRRLRVARYRRAQSGTREPIARSGRWCPTSQRCPPLGFLKGARCSHLSCVSADRSENAPAVSARAVHGDAMASLLRSRVIVTDGDIALNSRSRRNAARQDPTRRTTTPGTPRPQAARAPGTRAPCRADHRLRVPRRWGSSRYSQGAPRT